MIDCSIIVHNVLINVGDCEIPEDWRNDNDTMNEDAGQFVDEHTFANGIEDNAMTPVKNYVTKCT
jgi:hypothetical protein